MIRPSDFSVTNAGSTVVWSQEMRAGDKVLSVQISNVGTGGVFTYEVSNDGTNWVATSGRSVGTSGTAASSDNATGVRVFMVQTRWFRIKTSAGSGTVAGTVVVGEGWTI